MSRQKALVIALVAAVILSCTLISVALIGRAGYPTRLVLHVVPVSEDGEALTGTFAVVVRNLTDAWRKPNSEVVYTSLEYCPSITIVLNLRRRWMWWNGHWQKHEYLVCLFNNWYFGERIVRVEPNATEIEMTVEVVLHRHPRGPQEQPSPGPSDAMPLPYLAVFLEEVAETIEEMPAVQQHSISGIRVGVYFHRGNYLFYTAKFRYTYIWGQWSRWYSAGDKITVCHDAYRVAQVSNGAKEWINVCVLYRYERWLYDADWLTWYEEFVYPVDFSGAAPGNYIGCPYCGGEVSGQYQRWYREEYRGTITIYLGPGIHVVERYGLKVTFTVSYGPLTLSVELWKGNRDREGRRPTRS